MKVRTTIFIEEDLLKQLKIKAIENNKNYSEMFSEILQKHFQKKLDKKIKWCIIIMYVIK